MERMIISQLMTALMLLRGQIRCGQRTALRIGNMEDIDTLKENSFSERKPALVECWGRNLIRIKVQMRGKEAEAMSVGNVFQVFSCLGEHISGVKVKFLNMADLREYLHKMEVVSQEGERMDAKEGAELWRKRRVIFIRREGREG